MGYLKNKYNKSYFLKENERGEPSEFGVEGAELFKQNCPVLRNIDQAVLNQIDFSAKKVLEFGYGRGECLRYALEHGASVVFGVDFSEDAYSIASGYLERNGVKANIYCADALEFIKNFERYAGGSDIKFDVVLMLDFVEHVPRRELTLVLDALKKHFGSAGVIAINTPVFAVDNDVIVEGLKTEAIDSSDEFSETAGMHCNRYTKESLKCYMDENGFESITGHYFMLLQAAEAVRVAQPSVFDIAPENDVYETAARLRNDEVYQPRWFKIKGGILKDRYIYLDTKDGLWQSEYVEGTHDKTLFEYLQNKVDLTGKTVFDIGAHIGHHSLCFAQLVGASGKVFSFEPNPSNIDRMNIIFQRNEELAHRIKVNNLALSNSNGWAKFVFSGSIDNGLSSGSFLEGVSTPYDREDYERMSFHSMDVETCTLNDIKARIKFEDKVDVVKIDVEGAESLILESAEEFFAANKPLLLMEIHSIDNTTHVIRCLWKANYSIELLSFENENRLFIAAYPEANDSAHTSTQIGLANEMLKLYVACVEEKNRRTREIQMALEKEKEILEREKGILKGETETLKGETEVLKSEKETLRNENELFLKRYERLESIRKTPWGHFVLRVIKKCCS